MNVAVSLLSSVVGVVSSHPHLGVVAFVLLRSLAVIYPPIPGWPIDLLGIRLFGALYGFGLAESGIMLGASTAFVIGRSAQRLSVRPRWSDAIAPRLFGALGAPGEPSPPTFSRWFELRLWTNPLFDPICYIAGLTATPFIPYFLGTLLGNVPTTALFFMAQREALASGVWAVGLTAIAFLVAIWYIADHHLACRTAGRGSEGRVSRTLMGDTPVWRRADENGNRSSECIPRDAAR